MAEKEEKPKFKQYYEINAEAIAPVTIKYRVFAFSEEEAEQIFNKQPQNVTLLDSKINFRAMRIRKYSVKEMATSMIKIMKNIF